MSKCTKCGLEIPEGMFHFGITVYNETFTDWHKECTEWDIPKPIDVSRAIHDPENPTKE